MFESNPNGNSHPPMHQPSPPSQLSNITDPHQNPSYSYLNFPSHLLDDDELLLSTVLPYSSPLPPIIIPPPSSPPLPLPPPTTSNEPTKAKRKRAVAKMVAANGGDSGGKTKRRRGKTDRHSKINTAKGPRDRRMRLSLQIARKFFDLQDMLGFDKASKTIEWLFNKSKTAIKDLAERSCTAAGMASSPSDHQDMVNVVPAGHGEEDNIVRVKDKDSKNNNKGKKGALLFQAMKENREKARARARERTKEKLLLMQKKQGNEQNPNSSKTTSRIIRADGQMMDQSRYGIDDDYDDDEDDDQGQQHSLEDQMASVGIIDKYPTLFDFDHLDNQEYHQHMISRVPGSSSSCNTIMVSSNEISFSSFPTNWDVTQSMSMGANHTEIQNPNCGFLERPYNHGN